MDSLLVLIVMALIAVIITMMTGRVAMGAGDSRTPPKSGKQLMRARVGLQGFAIPFCLRQFFSCRAKAAFALR